MEFEFDDAKRDKTLAERGLDFSRAVEVWTPRNEVRRIISMRKANEREKAFYIHYLD